MTSAPGGGPVRVGLYGFFGAGNLGNEASLAAVLGYLRRRHPAVDVVCLGADPARVQREHGIGGWRLMAYRPMPGDRRPLTQLGKVLGRVRDLPRTAALVRRVDVLVVPGTGVLESRLMAGPWGLPYWMATAFTVARLTGRPSALLCVGAEPPVRRVTGLLLAGVLRSATVASFRDRASLEVAVAMAPRASRGEVVPDVVFTLPAPSGVAVRPGRVVVGVITFAGAPDDPHRGEEVVGRYVRRLGDVVARLLDSGRTVTLVVGDVSDDAMTQRVEAAVRQRRPGTTGEELSTSSARDIAGVMVEMASAEVVVASRFHNVIAALMTRRPVVSLSYAGKNADLLERFGLASFDQPVDDIDPDRVLEQVDALAASAAEVSARIGPVLDLVEAEVTAHLDEVWAGLLTSRVVARARRRQRARRSGASSTATGRAALPRPRG